MKSNSLIYYFNLLIENTSIEKELGELQRVSQYLNRQEDIQISVDELKELFLNSKSTTLDPKIWRRLENTDSNEIKKGDFKKVDSIAKTYNKTNPKKLIKQLQTNNYDKPLILKFNNRYHLVAGNTRLSTAAAMGIYPKVIIAEIPIKENTTGAVAGYLTPNAFTKNPPRKTDIKKQKDIQNQGVGKKINPTYRYTKKLD